MVPSADSHISGCKPKHAMAAVAMLWLTGYSVCEATTGSACIRIAKGSSAVRHMLYTEVLPELCMPDAKAAVALCMAIASWYPMQA